MENHKNLVVNDLYKKYYLKNETPETLVSSHWEWCQGKFKVEFNGNEMQSLSGFGFGEMQDRSLITKIFSWMTIASYMRQFIYRDELLVLMKKGVALAKRMGLVFSYDCFRQVCSLNLIMEKVVMKKERLTVINIGDGYGFLSALIKELFPNSLICLVDIGKTLLFQAYYCRKAHPDCPHRLVSDLNGTVHPPDSGFLYCPAEYLEELDKISFDVAINIASMQEMNQTSINRYFDFLRHHMAPSNLFYCCNREEKRMPGGEISRFLSYPWMNMDIHQLDEPCPWHHYFFSSSRAFHGPRFLGIRLPFINYFDGLHRHRLTILKTYG